MTKNDKNHANLKKNEKNHPDLKKKISKIIKTIKILKP